MLARRRPDVLLALGCSCGLRRSGTRPCKRRGVANREAADPVAARAAADPALVPVAAGNARERGPGRRRRAVRRRGRADRRPDAGGRLVGRDRHRHARGSRRVGRIPGALHDSAAVTIGASSYLFGGGTGVAQIDTILMVDPRTGAAQVVGHLPAGSSDQSAAAIGHTAYIVGGYTGTRWLDTIVAWSPGGHARVVAHLRTRCATPPSRPLRGQLVDRRRLARERHRRATPSMRSRPPPARVTRIGRLPAPTTHAAAAAIGGDRLRDRRPQRDRSARPTGRIVAVDPLKRTTSRRRHAAAAALGSRGGRHDARHPARRRPQHRGNGLRP